MNANALDQQRTTGPLKPTADKTLLHTSARALLPSSVACSHQIQPTPMSTCFTPNVLLTQYSEHRQRDDSPILLLQAAIVRQEDHLVLNLLQSRWSPAAGTASDARFLASIAGMRRDSSHHRDTSHCSSTEENRTSFNQ